MHPNPDALTERIIGAFLEVSNTLGVGFLEKVYERALLRELHLQNLTTRQATFSVTYKGACVGDYHPDILVEDTVIIELKCADRFSDQDLAQCLNYLRVTKLHLCLLVNFQKPTVEWKRVVPQPLNPHNRSSGGNPSATTGVPGPTIIAANPADTAFFASGNRSSTSTNIA